MCTPSAALRASSTKVPPGKRASKGYSAFYEALYYEVTIGLTFRKLAHSDSHDSAGSSAGKVLGLHKSANGHAA